MELDSKEDQSLDKLGDPDGPETKLKQRLAAIGSDWQRSETSEPMCRANWLRPRLGWTWVDRCLCGQWGYCELRRSCTGGCLTPGARGAPTQKAFPAPRPNPPPSLPP